jgi:hypothetical protein
MSRPSIAARAPWSAAALHWTQGGARWLTIAAKHVAWIDPGGAFVAQAPEPVRTHDQLAAGGLVAPAEIVPRTPGAEIFVLGRMLASAAREPTRRGRLRLVRGTSVLVDVGQVVPPDFAGAPFVPPALAPLARRFPVRARWLEGRDASPLDALAPDVPQGLDLRYFVAAAPGLAVDAIRAGDRIILEGLVAGRPAFELIVPGDAPRVRVVERGAVVEDVAPSLAAVAIDLERSLVVRVFRCVMRVDRRVIDELVVETPEGPAHGGTGTALVDPSVIAAMRATPFQSLSPVPAAPSAPDPSATGAVDADLLAQLRAAYRDGTPFAAKPSPSPSPAPKPKSFQGTPFQKPAVSEPAASRPVASTVPFPPQASPIEPAPMTRRLGGVGSAVTPPAPIAPPPPAPVAAAPPPAAPIAPIAPPPVASSVLVAAPPIKPIQPQRPIALATTPTPTSDPGAVTGAVDPAELRALREAHATPFRELLPTEKKAALRPPSAPPSRPPPSSSPRSSPGETGAIPSSDLAALRAAATPATPFRRVSSAPLEPFSTSWAEAFLCALKALAPVDAVGPR